MFKMKEHWFTRPWSFHEGLGKALLLEDNTWVNRKNEFSSVAQSCLTLCKPWTAACQASLSITNSRSSPKLMSIELAMPSSHLILCPFSSCLQSFPASVFSNESVLSIRWPKYWSFSFSISPSNEYSGLISFWIDWIDLLTAKGLSGVFFSTQPSL